MYVTTASPKRHGLAALLLTFAVLFHVLCSSGHVAEASEAASGAPIVTAVTTQQQSDSDPAVTSPHVHSAVGAHECAGAVDASADPRGSAAAALFLLLAVGLVLLAPPWAARLPVYLRPAARERRSRRRNAAPLLLVLCVWRI